MLSLKNVSAGYGGIDVVKDISFKVKTGENLSIIGPNGCGKTTLLKAIANLLPFTGDIELGGKSIHKMSRRDIAVKIAIMSQISGTYFSYSVFDTVMMGRYLHIKDRLMGVPSHKDKERVIYCLKAADIWDIKDCGITKLSGGQLQRVFLARTLAQEPEIILLDEPTNHLDLKHQVELIDYLRKWAKSGGRTVIGVLHDINFALRLSDNLMVMKDGRIQAYGKSTEILTAGILERTYEIDVAGYMRESSEIWKSIH